ncbi:hypothetical protein [Clostridium sp. BNL1100]|uniref:hypothetical protein n=1 Tax=Clostridium sp. BNL1100 TaxID=755731 RepID=UPI00024A780F|nr:hypothetical protein [Clostridium sp. BNL1100]AEY66089.1 hypothetical protein Clo1100_1884 [Clostridium sp. BNL1100]
MKKISFLFAISAFTLLITVACGKVVFDGSCTGNNKQFIVDYNVLNCTKTHQMELERGTTIKVVVESKSGRVGILVEDSKGDGIYNNINAISEKFSLEIPRTDTYNFSVSGTDAKGSVSFKMTK